MTSLHALILLAFATCLLWSVGVLVAVLADLLASSSARRSDADPAAAQDEALVSESLLAAFRPDALVPPT